MAVGNMRYISSPGSTVQGLPDQTERRVPFKWRVSVRGRLGCKVAIRSFAEGPLQLDVFCDWLAAVSLSDFGCREGAEARSNAPQIASFAVSF